MPGLEPLFPDMSEVATFREPFVGSGAMFFHLKEEYPHIPLSILSDINCDIIETFRQVRDDVHSVVTLVEGHKQRHSRKYVQQLAKRPLVGVENAARFIYFMSVAFNGCITHRADGSYIVATLDKKKPSGHASESALRSCSAALQSGVVLKNLDYVATEVANHDFVYLDPPYDQASIVYTKEGFNVKDQVDVYKFAIKCHEAGAKVLISNADTPRIRALFDSYPFHVYQVRPGKATSLTGTKRAQNHDLAITNYQPPAL